MDNEFDASVAADIEEINNEVEIYQKGMKII